MSKKRTLRDAITTVVHTIELYNPNDDFTLLEQAADKLASHYETNRDSEAELALKEFFERIPLSFTHSIKDITDHMKERYG